MIDFMISQRFDQMFVEWNRKKGHRPGLHASSVLAPEKGATAFCYREHVLAANFSPNESQLDVHVLRIFLQGWHMHIKWQQLFTDAGIADNVETTRYSKLWGVSFTPDAVIRLNHTRYIVEIKSMSTHKFKTLNNPPQNAVHQAQLYMHLTGIPNAIILVDDKNSQLYKVWAIKYDLDIVLPYLHRLQNTKELLHVYQEEGRLPRRIPECEKAGAARSRTCPFREACFASKTQRAELTAQGVHSNSGD